MLTVVTALLCVVTTACASDQSSRLTWDDLQAVPELDEISEDISEDQRDALADGEISEEEYEEGVRALQSCMEEHGYSISVGEKVNRVYEISYSEQAKEHAWDDCYVYEFQYIDAGWQGKPEIAEHSESSQELKQCILDLGHEPAASHPERLSQMEELRIDFAEDCLEQSGK